MAKEDDLLAAVDATHAEIKKIRAWYKRLPFYAGLVVGAVAALVVRRYG